MSQRRQDARRAKQERRREERRETRVQQRRGAGPTVPTAPGARPAATTTTRPAAVRAPAAGGSFANRRLLMLVGGVVGVLALVAISAFLLWLNNRPLPGVKFESNGNQHVTIGQPHGSYYSNPPTSGWHTAEIPRVGVYTQPFRPEELGHFTEHGGVWVLYTCPDGCPEVVADLESIVNKAIDQKRPTALAPYPAQGYAAPEKRINVVAWQYLLALDSVDRGQIEEFIGRHSCRYNPEGGLWCGAVKGTTAPEPKDAGAAGFNAATATVAPTPAASAPPAATPAAPAGPAPVGPTPAPAGTARP